MSLLRLSYKKNDFFLAYDFLHTLSLGALAVGALSRHIVSYPMEMPISQEMEGGFQVTANETSSPVSSEDLNSANNHVSELRGTYLPQ